MSTKKYILIVIFVVTGILSSFYSGYFLKEILTKDVSSQTPQNLMPYFSDQIILVTKDKPHYTIVASAARFTTDNILYTHRQRVYYFNGSEWQDDFSTTSSENLVIKDTPLIPRWVIQDDPSRVLKQTIDGEIQIGDTKIIFNVPLINNELGIRSLSNYTVFRSETTGKLVIDGKEHESYVFYDRTYSYNAEIGLISTADPIGINTHWLIFWDEDGNFYNIDETTVDDKVNGPYKSHSIAILKDKNENVQKAFTLDVQKNEKLGYQINILEKFSRSITVNFLNGVNKNPTNPTVENMVGQADGEVKLPNGKTIKGFGIYEYIYQ